MEGDNSKSITQQHAETWLERYSILTLTLSESTLWRWEQAAREHNIADNSAMAAFLLRHYETSNSELMQPAALCSSCATPLGQFCPTCFSLIHRQQQQPQVGSGQPALNTSSCELGQTLISNTSDQKTDTDHCSFVPQNMDRAMADSQHSQPGSESFGCSAASYDSDGDVEFYERDRAKQTKADIQHEHHKDAGAEVVKNQGAYLCGGPERTVRYGFDCEKSADTELKKEKESRSLCGEPETFTCEVCLQVFLDPDQLVMHTQTHCDLMLHECGQCKARFFQKNILILHMNAHQQEHTCVNYSAFFTQASTLAKQIANLHNTKACLRRGKQWTIPRTRVTEQNCESLTEGNEKDCESLTEGNEKDCESLTECNEKDCESLTEGNEKDSESAETSEVWSEAKKKHNLEDMQSDLEYSTLLRQQQNLPLELCSVERSCVGIDHEGNKLQPVIESGAETKRKESRLPSIIEESGANTESNGGKVIHRTEREKTQVPCMTNKSRSETDRERTQHPCVHFRQELQKRQHFSQSSCKGEQPFGCQDCGVAFNKLDSLVMHARSHYSKDRSFVCGPFNNHASKSQHMCRRRTKQLQCQQCGEMFRSHSQLCLHTCPTGPKESSRISNSEGGNCQNRRQRTKPVGLEENSEVMTKRQRGHSAVGLEETNEVTNHKQEHTEERAFQCSQCAKSFRSSARMAQHTRTHTSTTSIKQFPCQYCGKILKSLYTLKEHLRSHTGEKPFRCDVCQAQFTLSSTYKAHLRKHTGDRPYLCPHCGKSFIRSSNLSVHIRACTGDRPYTCAQCGKSFSDVGYFKKHVNNHAGIKPYKCSYCDKAFAQSTSLNFHVRVHTGEKPYKCSHCPMAFSIPNSLTEHMRKHTGDKPYKCSVCGKGFAKSCNRLAHFRTHSKNSVMSSGIQSTVGGGGSQE